MSGYDDLEKFLPYHIAEGAALMCMMKDGLHWSSPFPWRLTFLVDNDHPALTYGNVMGFVRDHVIPLCKGQASVRTSGLYLAEEEDVVAVYRACAKLAGPLGRIRSIQSREMYDLAHRFAHKLADGLRGSPSETTVERVPGGLPKVTSTTLLAAHLPDIAWDWSGCGRTGHGVASVQGHEVRCRAAVHMGEEGWALDVDDQPDCAYAREKDDAISKRSVADALKEHGLRQVPAPALAR